MHGCLHSINLATVVVHAPIFRLFQFLDELLLTVPLYVSGCCTLTHTECRTSSCTECRTSSCTPSRSTTTSCVFQRYQRSRTCFVGGMWFYLTAVVVALVVYTRYLVIQYYLYHGEAPRMSWLFVPLARNVGMSNHSPQQQSRNPTLL